MKTPYSAHFRSSVSDSRFDTGFRLNPQDTDEQIVARYLWNVAICEAFLGPLQYLEIALRNSFDRFFAAKFGPMWFLDRGALFPEDRGVVFKVQLELESEGKNPDDPGRIVAGLTLGFWLRILDKRYAKNGPRRLWDTSINQIFPDLNAPGGATSFGISDVRSRLYSVRLLRNRVAHHEPIWRGIRRATPGLPAGTPPPFVSLPTVHDELVEAVQWVSPALAHACKSTSRVGSVVSGGEAAFTPLVTSLSATWP